MGLKREMRVGLLAKHGPRSHWNSLALPSLGITCIRPDAPDELTAYGFPFDSISIREAVRLGSVW